MYQIFEQGRGNGIGLGLEGLIESLDEKCKSLNANYFAFILYDFKDDAYKKMLKDNSVFTELDRLSGKGLHLFYLHTAKDNVIHKFNSKVRVVLGINRVPSMPCVIFFKLENGSFTNIQLMELNGSGEHTRFNELYSVINNYLSNSTISSKEESKIIKSTVKIAYTEFIKQVVKNLAEFIT